MGPVPVHLLAVGPGHVFHGPDPVMRSAVSAISKARPTLAYVGCAAGDSAPFRLFITRWLKAAGAGRVAKVSLCIRRPDLATAKGVLDAADAVFVSGGDVGAGMAVLEDLGLTSYLRELAEQGKPFIGLSAGSIMLARSWVRWPDSDEEGSAEVFPCLGVAPVYCDTHDEEEGWEELTALLRLLPEGSEGWGIPSGGDLVVSAEGAVTWTGPPPTRLRRTAGGVVAV